MNKELTQERVKKCARCGAVRTDDIDSDICGNCADELRQQGEAWNEQSNADTGTD